MPIKYMDISKFVDEGYLQEVNRQFFHPKGMALVVSAETDDDTGEVIGSWTISGIWDARDDPEGIAFADGDLSLEKAEKVGEDDTTRYDNRVEALGYWVQPLPDPGETP